MRMHRREVVAGLGLTGLGLACGATARADSFPTKDINFIVPYAPGGGFDAYVRTVIPALQAQLGASARVLPDNVDGAAGAMAINQISRARPDGYSIAVVNIPGAIILQQQGGLGVDLRKLTWLCNMGRDPYGLMVPANSPIKSVADLKALGQTRPVKFTCVGPAGTAYSATRIGTALLGIKAQVIAGYKGTNDYVVAAMRGDGDAAVASLTALSQFRAGGLIRVLASFEEHSSVPGAEDATSLKQPELAQVVQLRPVAAPPRLPAELGKRLSDALTAALRDPAVVAWAQKNNANLQPDDAAATTQLITQQMAFVARWKDYLTAS